ncbi:hypothetical protein [Agrobacterium sp. LMR679]|uniref:hypothetical protein n=1 Tax=Agrobacterium sp. LMR679 TaxID=3014335 RepID=UPI0022B054EF|nr:hypothetical protein [Agrobacterium sp. LMR679]MCZ4072105.1 hypothetical protein [Agrobacterium sp. LMR679]
MTAKTKINGPSRAPDEGPRYQEECQFALEPSVSKLIELAVDAGWDREQVVYALLNLAAPHILDRTILGSEFLYQ